MRPVGNIPNSQTNQENHVHPHEPNEPRQANARLAPAYLELDHFEWNYPSEDLQPYVHEIGNGMFEFVLPEHDRRFRFTAERDANGEIKNAKWASSKAGFEK